MIRRAGAQLDSWTGAKLSIPKSDSEFELKASGEGTGGGLELEESHNLTRKIKIIKSSQNQCVQIPQVPPKRCNVFQTKTKEESRAEKLE